MRFGFSRIFSRWNSSLSAALHPSHDAVWVWGPLILIIMVGFAVTWHFADPAPPRELTIAAGGSDKTYRAFAERYATELKRAGITLRIVDTSGSEENLELLRLRKVSIALVQGGIARAEDATNLEALGGLFAEPIWIFVSANIGADQLSGLRGYRVALGGDGAVHRLATKLLAENGANETVTRIDRVDEGEAVRRMKAGETDAAILITLPESALVQSLLRDRSVRLLSIARTKAYARRFPTLTTAVLPEGIINLEYDVPATDIKLLAVAANLVTIKDLNATLVPLLLKTIAEVHTKGGLLETTIKFPSADLGDIPMDKDAERYVRNGPSFLYRNLPWRIAVFIDRCKILLLPFLALLVPLFQIGPVLYESRVTRRIFRWYRGLREIDAMIRSGKIQGDTNKPIAQLNNIEAEVTALRVPLKYVAHLYQLRLHINYMRGRLEQLPVDDKSTTNAKHAG